MKQRLRDVGCLFRSHTASACLSWDLYLDVSDVKTGTLPVNHCWPSPVAEDMRSGGETGAQDPATGTLQRHMCDCFLLLFFLLGWLGPAPLAPACHHLLRAASCRGASAWPGDHPWQRQEVREVGWAPPRAGLQG